MDGNVSVVMVYYCAVEFLILYRLENCVFVIDGGDTVAFDFGSTGEWRLWDNVVDTETFIDITLSEYLDGIGRFDEDSNLL